MKNHCTSILKKLGASDEIISFYSDALQVEYEISHTIYKLQSKLKNDLDESDTISPNLIFALLQTMTKHFRSWKTTVDRLAAQGTDLPRIHLDEQNINSLKMITAVCSMNTNELHMTEGEQVQIMDTSKPNWLKVKNLQGEEGFLPTLSCLIPTPDNDAVTTVERLQVILLASWTECIRQLRPILTTSACLSSKQIHKLWVTFSFAKTFRRKERLNSRLKRLMDCSSKSNATLDLNKVHCHLSKLENELLNLSDDCGGAPADLSFILRSVEGLDRAVLCYQSFFSQWGKFRRGLSDCSRPIRIVEHWEELRRAARFKQFKYYELKMTLTEVETDEEILYINSHTGEAYTSETKKKRQKVMAEELKTSKHEELKRFMIKGVVDPRSGDHVSFKYAIDSGILEAKTGLYVNPDTGEALPIERALLEGRVILEYSSVMKNTPRTSTTPLLTLTKRTDLNYRVKGAIDATTAEQVDVEEAARRGLIDVSSGNYVHPLEGSQLSEQEAVQEGWIVAEFDDSNPRYESETHEIVEVFDRELACFLPHKQALLRGLLHPLTGDYVDSSTGDVVYSVDAICMGLIKTRRRKELFD